jgi:hypothetical protein
MKSRIIKIYCTAQELKDSESEVQVIQNYAGFQVAAVPPAALNRLRRRFPIEDITEQYELPVGGAEVNTTQRGFGKSAWRAGLREAGRLARGPHHYLVQFVGPVKNSWLSAVRKAGGEIRTPYHGFTYVVRADKESLDEIGKLPQVRWVGHLPHHARVAPGLLNPKERPAKLPRTRHLPDAFTIEFFGDDDLRKGVSAIRKLGAKVLAQRPGGKVLTAAIIGNEQKRRATISDISAIHGVRYIRQRAIMRPSNNIATEVMGTARTSGSSNLGLTGKGEIVGICDTGLDTGDPTTIHQDFHGRVVFIRSYPIPAGYSTYLTNAGADDGPADVDSGHGTHVTGSVLGDGSASAGIAGLATPVRGLAREAQLVFQAVEQEVKWRPQYATDPNTGQPRERYSLFGIPDDLGPLFAEAYNKGARVHSNSWGGGDPGAYDPQCQQLDQFVWNHKDFCIVVAAGNDGKDTDANGTADGKINLGSVSAPGTAKNCITVGACENLRPEFNTEKYGDWWPDSFPKPPFKSDSIADNPSEVVPFSSRGPTVDGRIKPEVISPGTFILSTRSTQIAPNNFAWAKFPASNLYFFMGGTSMATPLTAGAVALVRQFYRTVKNVPTPSAALLKATLVCGATRLSGYASTSAEADNHQGFGRVNLDAALAPASPTALAFEDASAGLRTGDIHEWPLKVVSTSVPLRVTLAYTDYPGPNLVNNLNLIVVSPSGKRYAGNQASGSGLKLDSANNVEVVTIKKPTKGTWKVQVVAANVAQGSQDFALVALGGLG